MMGDTAPAWRQDPRRCGSNGAGKLGEPFLQIQVCFNPKTPPSFQLSNVENKNWTTIFPLFSNKTHVCGGMKSIELTQLVSIPTPSTWLLWRTLFVDDLQWPFGVLGTLTVLLVIMSSNEVSQSVAWRCKSKSMVSCQHGWNVSGYSLFPSCFLCILQLLHFCQKHLETGWIIWVGWQRILLPGWIWNGSFHSLSGSDHWKIAPTLGSLGNLHGQLGNYETQKDVESVKAGGGWGGYWLGSTQWNNLESRSYHSCFLLLAFLLAVWWVTWRARKMWQQSAGKTLQAVYVAVVFLVVHHLNLFWS